MKEEKKTEKKNISDKQLKVFVNYPMILRNKKLQELVDSIEIKKENNLNEMVDLKHFQAKTVKPMLFKHITQWIKNHYPTFLDFKNENDKDFITDIQSSFLMSIAKNPELELEPFECKFNNFNE